MTEISHKPSMTPSPDIERRKFLLALASAGVGSLLWPGIGSGSSRRVITRAIPSSGETIPVIGLGSTLIFLRYQARTVRRRRRPPASS